MRSENRVSCQCNVVIDRDDRSAAVHAHQPRGGHSSHPPGGSKIAAAADEIEGADT
jgi:hypothetical protein